MIVHKNDVGRCMYIIVDGRIRHHIAGAQGIIRMLCQRVRAREYEG
jgi:hypothetical protein